MHPLVRETHVDHHATMIHTFCLTHLPHYSAGLGVMNNPKGHGLIEAAEEETMTKEQVVLLASRVAGGKCERISSRCCLSSSAYHDVPENLYAIDALTV